MVEPTIEERTVNGLAIYEHDDTKIFAVRLGNRDPSTNAPIVLNHFAYRRVQRTKNPFFRDDGSIGAHANGPEIRRRLHGPTLTEEWFQAK